MENSEERPENKYEFTVRSVVEQVYVVAGRNSVEADLSFQKLRDKGEIEVLGVVQSIKCEKKDDLKLDPEEWKIHSSSEGPGCPVFWTVVHKGTGLRKTKTSLREAYDKVLSDLARRKLNYLEEHSNTT